MQHMLSTGKERSSFSELLRAEMEILESFTSAADGTKMKTGFNLAKLTLGRNDKSDELPKQAAEMLRQVAPVFFFDKADKPQRRLDFNFNPNVPMELAQEIYDFRHFINYALEASNFTLPGRTVQAGESWEARPPVSLNHVDGHMLFELVLKCKYEGIRTRSGNREALVTFEGLLKSRDPKTEMRGDVAGKFTFDPTQRIINSVHLKIHTMAIPTIHSRVT